MKRWRMRTTLMVSLLAVSLGLTATCLLIIRISVKQEIQRGLTSDLNHSLETFKSIAAQRNEMLSREAALLADLPSLKSLMATQDKNTIEDASEEFWRTSGSDFFGLLSPTGTLFTYSNLGPRLEVQQVTSGLRACMAQQEESCLTSFGDHLYEISIQPAFFGPLANRSQLGYVVIGYSIDSKLTREISNVAAAEVAFLTDGEVSSTTLPAERLHGLRLENLALPGDQERIRSIRLGKESYVAAALMLRSAGPSHVSLVVLKSYDQASLYLRRVNQWILTLGICSLVLGIILAAAISRSVTKPLETLVAGTRALGQGDFNYRLSTDGAVEVRELGLAFDRMRGELQRTQAKLLESDRLATIGRMASSVSHDLRHHLSAIYANAEFMSLARTGEAERSELLLEVQEAVRGMTDLIESLLLFSQTGQVLHLQYESIASLVERTVQSVRRHPECREVRVSIEELQPVEAWVDGSKLGRALYNLLLNACQASKAGSESMTVAVKLLDRDERIHIVIKDSGAGIPPDILDTLFQPFVSSGKVNGTGLGLTVAQHIAQEHGGEVKLESSSPGSTTFSIVLHKKALQMLRRNSDLSTERVSRKTESLSSGARQLDEQFQSGQESR